MLRPDETRQLFQDVRGDLWWLPDGRAIYQVVEPSTGVTAFQDTCNFWARRFDSRTGKPVEPAKRLTNWTGFCISNANATADGKRLAFVASSGHMTSYVADLEAGGKRVVNPRHFIRDE